MIEYILLAGAAVVVGSAVGNMLYRPPANVCTPGARGCQLTGAYQDRQAMGEGAVGGYYEQAQIKQESAGHIEYWDGRPMPAEVPDMGRVQVNTHHKGAAGNQQELDRWHSLNANEWARVDAPEHEQVNR